MTTFTLADADATTRLGQAIAPLLAPGESATVTIADGATVCDYDLQIVMENEATMEGTADLCELNEFTVTDK